ncbi:MAG: PHP domain-containing protein [Candidatus Lokiarchaeota archaeon]|nr:PHP domain-containing protein [Candidatus Lokiarchaeota archaeon]
MKLEAIKLMFIMNDSILKLEPHVHTNFSDGMDYKIMLKAAVKLNIDVIAITDHDTMGAIKPAMKFLKTCNKKYGKNLILIPAEEIRVKGNIEILAYFINEQIKPNLSLEETIDKIHEQGGLIALAHPFRPPLYYKKNVKILQNYKLDGIEIWNFGFPPFLNERSCALAKNFPKLFRIGGTDAHFYWQFGLVRNYLKSEPDIEGIFKALKNNKNKVENVWLGIPYYFYYFHKFFLKNRKILANLMRNQKK